MPKKLLLINPKSETEISTPGKVIPPLAFAYIAAVTPKDWDIEVLDEDVEEFKLKNADLVGITTLTVTVNRAYKIAEMYRQKGVKVILGGIHASMLPDEALKFCDSVLVGEAESVWPEVIKDFENGDLQKLYKGEFLPFETIPPPRMDIFKNKYLVGVVQTTRGCPMNCNFCSVTAFNGNRYRMRPVEDVLDELERIPQKYVFFVDDNLIGHSEASKKRALELFKGMIDKKLNKKWLTQVSLNFADDDELLYYASKSGCRGVLIGFESISEKTLKGMNKKINLRYGIDYYNEVVRKLHKFGIEVNGQIIIGNDEDDEETITNTIDFFNRSEIDIPNIAVLIPFPGTKLFEKYEKEGRIMYKNFPADWNLYSGLKLIHKPQNLSKDQLKKGYEQIRRELFSFGAILRRSLKALFFTRDFLFSLLAWKFNASIKNTFLKEVASKGL